MSATATYQTKKTLNLAYPVILGQLAQMALGLIDVAMIGKIGYVELAAGSLANSILNIPMVLGIGITISVSQLVSMANGRRDSALVSHYLYNGFLLSLATALVIYLILELGKGALFHMNQDIEVATMAVPYLQLISISIIPMLLFMALKQFTDGLEFTKTAMVISLSAIPLNFFLNWLLIFGNWGFPRLELVGAGWGTLITRLLVFVALAGVVLRHKLFHRYIIIRKKHWYLKKKTWKDLLYIGVPSSLQIGMESGAFAVSAILVGTLGAREQAAHQIAMTMVSLAFMIPIGLSQAGSIRISNAFGRRDWPLLRLIGKTTLRLGVGYGIFSGISFALFKSFIPPLFNDDPEVIQIATVLLLFAAVFQISDSTQGVSAGLLRGVKDVRIPTLFIAIAYWVVGLPIGSLLTFHYEWGPKGIWTGFILGLTVSAILLSQRFKRISATSTLEKIRERRNMV